MSTSPYITVTDHHTFSVDHFAVPKHYVADLESIMLPHGMVVDRIRRMAADVHRDFLISNKGNTDTTTTDLSRPATPLVAICILKGGHQFFSDLLAAVKALNASSSVAVPIALEFIRVQSYHNDQSTGQVDIQLTGKETWDQLSQRWRGKHLLVVEDIVDTGKTMSALLARLNNIGAQSVRVASLFIKRVTATGGKPVFVPDYAGFSIPDKFIVGYGLDYNEYFRDLDHVAVLNDRGKRRYAV